MANFQTTDARAFRIAGRVGLSSIRTNEPSSERHDWINLKMAYVIVHRLAFVRAI